jgi:excisionase family DNA binding protein
VPDEPHQTPDDPWLTLVEIAEELRLSPVTIRSWIAKGRLKAKRAGQRKWLVRRSDLDRLLELDAASASAAPPPEPAHLESAVGFGWPPGELERLADEAEEHVQQDNEQWLAMANYEWEVALEQSRKAPPNAWFASRIRQIARAAAVRAHALRERMSDSDFVWTPVSDSKAMTLSYELRPGGNRPGPRDEWARFDRVVSRLGDALEGHSPAIVAGVLGDLARVMNELADAIEHLGGPRPSDDPPDEDLLDGVDCEPEGAE